MESLMYYLNLLLNNMMTAFDVYRREGKGCIKILIIPPSSLHAFINVCFLHNVPFLIFSNVWMIWSKNHGLRTEICQSFKFKYKNLHLFKQLCKKSIKIV